MTETLTQLLDLDAVAGDDRFPVRALFHDPTDFMLTHVALDVGGWLDRREVLLSIDRFGFPQDGEWPLTIEKSEIEDAPELSGSDAISDLPPLVIGPFGYTFSPMLMAAGMTRAAAQSTPSAPDGDVLAEAGGRLAHVERSTDWIGREAFGPDGSLGTVEDLRVEDMKLTAVILSDGSQRALSSIRSQPEGGHVVFG